MQRLILPSSEIYPYQIEVDKIIPEEVMEIIWSNYDFQKVPPIPVYEIPEELRLRWWKYAFPDGNRRWLYGHVTSQRVLTILLDPSEKIDIEWWGMANFRNAHNPDLYKKTLWVYRYQERI